LRLRLFFLSSRSHRWPRVSSRSEEGADCLRNPSATKLSLVVVSGERHFDQSVCDVRPEKREQVAPCRGRYEEHASVGIIIRSRNIIAEGNRCVCGALRHPSSMFPITQLTRVCFRLAVTIARQCVTQFTSSPHGRRLRARRQKKPSPQCSSFCLFLASMATHGLPCTVPRHQ